jgi:hypothetical protein
LLTKIRPEWQAKSLIKRVRRLLPVDLSSACQRLLNAAIQDLREKTVIAGIDLAKQAAAAHNLPSVTKQEDILENYSTSNVLDIAYWMGILSRPEWRRLSRSYEIRKDLEHEDDEYEAQLEDLVYVFKTAIEIVLAREPVEVLTVSDVREFVQQPQNAIPSVDLLEDFEKAPDSRQLDVGESLVRIALNDNEPDIVRQNAVEALRKFRPFIRNTVAVELSKSFQERLKRRPLTIAQAKVASAAGILVYLKQRNRKQFFEQFSEKLWKTGYRWTNNSNHGCILDELQDVGGFAACPPGPIRERMILWATLCYLGEPGGYGDYGRRREVFYSDSAAWRILKLFRTAGIGIKDDLKTMEGHRDVKAARERSKAIARRYEDLVDLADAT